MEFDLRLDRVLEDVLVQDCGIGKLNHPYIVTRERSPLEHNLVLLLRRLVESSHHEMQIDSQSVHDNDFLRRSSNNGGALLRALRGHVLVGSQGRVLELCKVASDGDRSPCLQISSEVFRDGFGLES